MLRRDDEPTKQNLWEVSGYNFRINLSDIRYVDNPEAYMDPIDTGTKRIPTEPYWKDIKVIFNKVINEEVFKKLNDLYYRMEQALLNRQGLCSVIINQYDPLGHIVGAWKIEFDDFSVHYGHFSNKHVEYPYIKFSVERCRSIESENNKNKRRTMEDEELDDTPIEQHRKEALENKENNNGAFSSGRDDARVIDVNEFLKERPDLYNWLYDHWGHDFSDHCIFIKRSLDNDNNLVRVKLYTNDHVYSIKTMLGHDKDYMDCVVQNRKCNIGEDWHRGSDLSDGKYDHSTFKKIIRDILKREFLEVNVATENN